MSSYSLAFAMIYLWLVLPLLFSYINPFLCWQAEKANVADIQRLIRRQLYGIACSLPPAIAIFIHLL